MGSKENMFPHRLCGVILPQSTNCWKAQHFSGVASAAASAQLLAMVLKSALPEKVQDRFGLLSIASHPFGGVPPLHETTMKQGFIWLHWFWKRHCSLCWHQEQIAKVKSQNEISVWSGPPLPARVNNRGWIPERLQMQRIIFLSEAFPVFAHENVSTFPFHLNCAPHPHPWRPPAMQKKVRKSMAPLYSEQRCGIWPTISLTVVN